MFFVVLSSCCGGRSVPGKLCVQVLADSPVGLVKHLEPHRVSCLHSCRASVFTHNEEFQIYRTVWKIIWQTSMCLSPRRNVHIYLFIIPVDLSVLVPLNTHDFVCMLKMKKYNVSLCNLFLIQAFEMYLYRSGK